jgi:DNA-binding transcriptional LysR family regulator
MKRAGLFELHAVVAVSTHRSFRAAAAELNMSPSALSHAIAALERRLGVRLFNRTTRSVSLTAAGEQFLARVQPALSEIGQALEDVNQFRDTPRGVLRINTAEGALQHVLIPVMQAFLSRHQDMQVDVVSEGRMVDIVAEGFDAGIRIAEAVPQDMVAVPFGPPLRFAVVGAPAYFRTRKKPRAPADLLSHDCLRMRLPSGKLYHWEFEKRGEAFALDVTGALTLGSAELRVEAALAGLGLAYVLESSVADHLAAGRLVRVLEDWTPTFPGLRLYYPGHRHVPAGLRALIEVVRELAAGAA